MAGNPEVTSIIAILVGGPGLPPPPPSKEFGADMQAHNLASDTAFGQDLKVVLLPAVQHEDSDLLGVAPHDHGVF